MNLHSLDAYAWSQTRRAMTTARHHHTLPARPRVSPWTHLRCGLRALLALIVGPRTL